jgi:hypothetical protein
VLRNRKENVGKKNGFWSLKYPLRILATQPYPYRKRIGQFFSEKIKFNCWILRQYASGRIRYMSDTDTLAFVLKLPSKVPFKIGSDKYNI